MTPRPTPVQKIRNAQPAIIEVFTLLSPYAAAALPAALSGGNVVSHIMPNTGSFGVVVGVAAGLGLEMIGIAVGWVIVNIIQKTRNTPLLKNWKLWAALYAGLHYVIANLSANVGMVAFGENPWTLGVATGALSTMSVPAVIVSVLWALEIEEKSTGDATDEKKRAANKEATALAFEQGMARMAQQNAHELAQLQARSAAELAMAKERTRQIELEAEKIRAELSRENHDKPGENYQGSFSNVTPERGQWVRDYMANNSVSQATAYRKYAELYTKNGASGK